MSARSYVAKVQSTNERFLTGGVKEHVSSRFGSRGDAEQFGIVVMEINAHAAPVMGVYELPRYPEIFRHCANAEAQALGGKCNICGTKLTAKEALEQ